jgi:Rha family phage regulatory protein
MVSQEVSILTSNGKAVVSSRELALRFQKKHKNILQEIERIRSMTPKKFTELNFQPSEYTDPTGRALPCFNLTRDAFSLLAMGFTGKAAIMWKLKYIEAFNQLEAAALDALSGQIASTAASAAVEAASRFALLPPARLHKINKAVAYRKRGLTPGEIGLLLGVSRRRARYWLDEAGALGLLPGKEV